MMLFLMNFCSTLTYTSQTYLEAMAMRPKVSYIPCATSARGGNGDIITFAKFEEVNLLSETREYTESNEKSGDKSDDDSIMPSLPSLE